MSNFVFILLFRLLIEFLFLNCLVLLSCLNTILKIMPLKNLNNSNLDIIVNNGKSQIYYKKMYTQKKDIV